MFKAVTERRVLRRLWSPRTVAASVLVNAVLAAGLMMALKPPDTPVEKERPPVVFRIDQEEAEPRESGPSAPTPGKPRPRVGEMVELPAPETVPDSIREQDPEFRPLLEEHLTGLGRAGAAFGPSHASRPLPTGSTGPQPGGNLPVFYPPIPAESADTRPELADRRQAEMILQRNYPPLLRDIGAMGRTTVMLIIDSDGNVEPGSVQVQESTDDAFRDAAIRAVERFRFKPATLNGRPVAVLATLPIVWRLEN